MAEKEDEETYCLCRRPYHPSEFMIECDVCKDWFHGSCVGIEEHQSSDIETYHCPNCQPEHGPLTLKRRRNWHRHDYSELNDGSKAIQSGTVVFVDKLKRKKFQGADDVVLKTHGTNLTLDFLEQHGFNQPMVVKQKEGLGLKVPPPEFRISDVERYVGSMREVDVIDVSRQEDIQMKMREWTEYYENQRPRKKILNVISLEFSNTELSKLVSPPSVVRKLDWIERHWPETLPEDSPLSRPEVQKYCLMSVKDSYTDFHVDFGGTSVWYHIIWGEKIFYLIPPTDENLIRYENWVMSSNQSEVFFGDLVPECYMHKLQPGNTFFIPTGWIHAVLTPVDSLVFGGNFLHRYNIALQLRIHEMERRLDTPLKFLHPCYEALNWFAARDLLRELKDHYDRGTVPRQYLLEGLREVVYTLTSWTRTKESLKAHRAQIPPDIKHTRLVEQLNQAVSRFKQVPIQPVVGSEGLKFRIRKRSGSEGRGEGDIPRKRTIKMRLSASGSRVVRQSEDEEQRISMKLSVPQATVVSSSVGGAESDSDVSVGKGDETYQPLPEDVFSSDGEDLEISDLRVGRTKWGSGRRKRGGRRESEGSEGSEGENEYEDSDFIYPSLVNESEAVSSVEGGRGRSGAALPPRGRRRSSKDDDLWMPQGPVKLIKGSIASSPRQKRNARKRSFEQTLSVTAANILKLEQDRKAPELDQEPMTTEVKPKPPLLPEVRPTDPVLGGGSLRGGGVTGEGGEEGDVPGTKRSRATAAATAVDAYLAASRPKSKPLTAKQRLGKILGLKKAGGGRWTK